MTSKIHNILTLGILSLFCLSSCNSIVEPPGPDPIAGKVQIGLDLSSIESPGGSTYATPDEDKLASLELFIFNSSTGAKDFSVYLTLPAGTAPADIDLSRWVSENIIMVLNADVLSSLNVPKDVHIVANMAKEKTEWVTNSERLRELITDDINDIGILDPSQKPFVMHGSVLNHNFSTNTKATISLRRNVSKVQLTVNTTDFTHSGENIALVPAGTEILHRMANVANTSFVIGRGENPGGTPGTLHIEYNATTMNPIRTGSSTKSEYTTYINENLCSSYNLETQATYVMLQIPFKRGVAAIDKKNYYKILVNAENGYRIDRNTIYAISTNISTLGGTTESTAVLIEGEMTILPWDERTVQSDISQTYLKVATTNLIMGITHNFAYGSNATITTTKDAGNDWFTAVVDGASNIKITATAPTVATRTGSFYIMANNIKKKINITQAGSPVNDGSILLNPRVVYLSEVAGSTAKAVALTVAPTSSSWLMTMSAGVATVNYASGTGNRSLTFTRTITAGNAYYAFTNLTTMKYDSVQVCNLSLTVPPDVIQISGDGATSYEPGIVALGGDETWEIVSKSTWITASKSGNNLNYVIPAEPSEQDRVGYVEICHKNEPNLKRRINFNQSAKFIKLEDYDFLQLAYDWTSSKGKDMDTKTFFVDSRIASLDGSISRFVGWSGNSSMADAQQVILEWGGDNRAVSGTENVIVFMQRFKSESNLAYMRNQGVRYVHIYTYAMWFSNPDYVNPITVRMYAYKGGAMVKKTGVSSNDPLFGTYTNPTGKIVKFGDKDFWEGKLRITTSNPNYTQMAIITYDIEKNSTMAEIVGGSLPAPPHASGSVIEMLPGESKEAYGARISRMQK